MLIYRLGSSRYPTNTAGGNAGRWNHRGTKVIYAASTISLCALEVLASRSRFIGADCISVPIEIPDDLNVRTLEPKDLPPNWTTYPHPMETRDMGTGWIDLAETAVLSVPSALIASERNYILNPSHPDFSRIRFGPALPFTFDARLRPSLVTSAKSPQLVRVETLTSFSDEASPTDPVSLEPILSSQVKPFEIRLLGDPSLDRDSPCRPAWEDRLLRRRKVSRSMVSLTPERQELKFLLHRKLADRVNFEAFPVDTVEGRCGVGRALQELIEQEPTLFSTIEKQEICGEVLDEVFGLGPLEPLLHDPTVATILVNGNRQVFVERMGRLELTGVTFRDDQHLLRIINRALSVVHLRVDEMAPLATEARLIDGSVVSALAPPLAVDGPLLSIRTVNVDVLPLATLVERKAMTQGMAEFLEACVQSKVNLAIIGGKRSGKTALLSALCSSIGVRERIVSFEGRDTLVVKHPHVARLQMKAPRLDGTGEICQSDLMEIAVRMRADRIICDDLKGDAAFGLLKAMNTEHEGSLMTLYSSDPGDAVSRLEFLVSVAHPNTSLGSIREQISRSIDLFVQTERMIDGSFRVAKITEVNGIDRDVIKLQDIFVFEMSGGAARCGRFTAKRIRPQCYKKILAAGRRLRDDIFTELVDTGR